ncbi:MAG: hypothetical protein GQ574_17030 [Crocinitomix sp.]|nr:hypothetical protein [Crocinitomix sp.]
MRSEIIKHIGTCTNANCKCSSINEPFVETTAREVFIFDDDKEDKLQPCQLVGKDDKHQITILNKEKKPFTFVKIDACIINDKEKRCDALVYNARQFYYVEIKDTTVKGRKQARKRAVKQLEATILRMKSVDFSGRELFAIHGFASPKSRIINVGSAINKVHFMEKYGVKLMEGHAIPLAY